MGAARFQFVAPAAPDAAPNATAPIDSRLFSFPVANQGLGSRVWFASVGGTITLQLWAFEPSIPGGGRWYAVGAPVASTAADTQTLFAAASVPLGVQLFAQVTVLGAGVSRFYGGLVET
jgi:hypothetical protein